MKVVFLDRDGVINKYPGDANYVTSLREFHLIAGVKEAVYKLTLAQYKIFVISNQAAISKGIYSQDALDEITSVMLKELSSAGGYICGVYYCIHRDEDKCLCRKPKIGLIQKAVQKHNISLESLKNAFFIGDSIKDIQAGRDAGCQTILVYSGKEKPGNQAGWAVQPDFTALDLSEAVKLILAG